MNGKPQGGMKSEAGRAAYWRMQHEAAVGALADLIAENTENVEFARDFYEHNADLLSDYWRERFTRVFPTPTPTTTADPERAASTEGSDT